MAEELTIRTSATGWLEQLAVAYREQREVLVVDDAEIGLDPGSQSLIIALSRQWHKAHGQYRARSGSPIGKLFNHHQFLKSTR